MFFMFSPLIDLLVNVFGTKSPDKEDKCKDAEDTDKRVLGKVSKNLIQNPSVMGVPPSP